LEGASARINSIKDYVNINEGQHKEKLAAFLHVLSSLGFTETPSNVPFGTVCSVPMASRVIVMNVGYVIIIVIWIIGISQGWGLLFKLVFCLAPMLWMMIIIIMGMLVFKKEVMYSLNG